MTIVRFLSFALRHFSLLFSKDVAEFNPTKVGCNYILRDPLGLDNRDGAVVRALASHQCVLGAIPGPGVICGLSLLLVLVSAEGFPRVLRSSPLLKNQHFQIPILAWKVSPISAKALEDMTLK